MPRGLRSELDALVTFRPDPRNPSVTGDIRVAQSAYTETISIAALARQAATPVSPNVQRPYLDLLTREYGEQIQITHLPLFAGEIKGAEQLRELEKLLFAA